MKKYVLCSLVLAGTMLFSGCGKSSTSKDDTGISLDSKKYDKTKLTYGKLLDRTETGSTLVIKAKITSSYNNKATVDQNYYNVEDIIKYKGGRSFTEIQYWAVADMSDGSEQKVVSFTVSQSVIKKIANGEIVANQMGNYVDDLFIHPSLR